MLEDRPQNHWLDAYLGVHPSSTNHEATTTPTRYVNVGVVIWSGGKGEKVVSAPDMKFSGQFEYFGHGRFLRNMGGRQVESSPSGE